MSERNQSSSSLVYNYRVQSVWQSRAPSQILCGTILHTTCDVVSHRPTSTTNNLWSAHQTVPGALYIYLYFRCPNLAYIQTLHRRHMARVHPPKVRKPPRAVNLGIGKGQNERAVPSFGRPRCLPPRTFSSFPPAIILLHHYPSSGLSHQGTVCLNCGSFEVC
ncbi:uncharacterized protein BO72DRAFT_68583 [Aspergillus fijiensis CBS 313.89]|uniref:Uncharacterized protein n=1 Tax=Aspergillus fijiensis CBS 313.89 TaxID=1448319 RepID=A0A8G1RTZ7_9EURO|nr:uncharacterized protein BO72DRAFT_68583 [Aspergillus fijiensis CBS 313.89]RAK78702.1 hypothetical protein BO72DRAFT_68583 [Aspergillus fijiensis CBS 313.89]